MRFEAQAFNPLHGVPDIILARAFFS